MLGTCYHVENMDGYIICNCWRISRILLLHWNVDFAMEDELEKKRMVKEIVKLAILIVQLMFGNEEFPLQDYVVMVGEECIEP